MASQQAVRTAKILNLTAGARRFSWHLLIVSFLLLIIGCTIYQNSASPTRFWAKVRPASGETERLMRNVRFLKIAGRTDLALKELEEAHQRDPDNLQIVDILTQCYEDLGDWERAEELYLEALAKDESNPALSNNLCFSYYLAGKLERAESSFRKLLERHPHNATIRNNLGLVLTRLGRQDEAYALWREAEGESAARNRLHQALAALGLKTDPVANQPKGPNIARDSLRTTSLAPAAGDQQRKNMGEMLAATPEASAQQGAARQTEAAVTSGDRDPNQENRHSAPAHPPAPAVSPVTIAGLTQTERLPILRAWELLYTKIEILNGNGVNNLARQNRSWLHLEGFDTVAIGNYKNFAQDQTIIIYRPQAARVAKVLGAKFYQTDNLRINQELQVDLDVRVVLGRDVLQKEDVLAKLAD